MHIEVLVEDSSGATLVMALLPKLIGENGAPHTWRVHAFRGMGQLPRDLNMASDPAQKTLLARLPGILKAHGKTAGIGAVVVVLDSDRRDCKLFLRELKAILKHCEPAPNTLFRLAIEEVEAWYLGDRPALYSAYPRTKKNVLKRYKQDGVCGTWELLADAIHPGGSGILRKAGWPLPGQVKHEWAERIADHMNVEKNQSPSFCKLRDGIRRLLA